MAATDIDTLPFPIHVQMNDGAAIGRSRHTNGVTGGGSRYAPFWEKTRALKPTISTLTGAVGTFARFAKENDTADNTALSNFWYRIAGSKIDGKYGVGEDDAIDELPSTWHFEVVFRPVFGAVTAALDLFQFQLDSGNNDGDEVWWQIRQSGVTTTVLRKRNYQAGTDGNTALANDFVSGNTYSLRISYTAASAKGTYDGSISIYRAAGDAFDADAKGTTLTWSEMATTTHDGGKLLRVAMGWESASNTHIVAGHGNYIKGWCLLGEAPVSISTGTSSWNRLHRRNLEKAMLWWDGANWQCRAAMIHHHGLLGEGDIKTQQRLRYFTSLANLTAGTAAATGTFDTAADDGNGYWRTLDNLDLPADTEVWLEVQNFNDDSGGDWFMRGNAGEYIHFRTPPAPGGTQTLPIRLHLRGCENTAKGGPTSRAQTVDYCDPTAQCDIILDTGDNLGGGYMDEESWDKSGTEYEGAETDQHFADAHACFAHGWHRLVEVSNGICGLVMSDHDGVVNDARRPELWADGTTAQWGKGGANDPIDNLILTEYQTTPRALMDLLAVHHRNRVYDAMVLSTQSSALKAWRHQTTGNKYGVTPFDANDSGYYAAHYGRHYFIFMPLRDFANFHTGGTNILWGQAQATIEGWLAGITQAGTTVWFVTSEWITGFDEATGTLKNNDNPSSMRNDADVTAKILAVFGTAVDANANIEQSHILTFDHHFEAYLLQAQNPDTALSDKILSQVSCGCVSGLGHDPAGLGSGVTLEFGDRLGSAVGDPVRALAYIDIPVSGSPTLTVKQITGTTTATAAHAETMPVAAVTAGRRTRSRDRRVR